MALIIFADRSCLEIPAKGYGIDYISESGKEKTIMRNLTPEYVIAIIRRKDSEYGTIYKVSEE